MFHEYFSLIKKIHEEVTQCSLSLNCRWNLSSQGSHEFYWRLETDNISTLCLKRHLEKLVVCCSVVTPAHSSMMLFLWVNWEQFQVQFVVFSHVHQFCFHSRVDTNVLVFLPWLQLSTDNVLSELCFSDSDVCWWFSLGGMWIPDSRNMQNVDDRSLAAEDFTFDSGKINPSSIGAEECVLLFLCVGAF